MTADTSVVVAALIAWHDHHEPAAAALADVAALPAHAMTETYSVLTRLPGGRALSASVAVDLLAQRFPDPVLVVGGGERAALLRRLADAGVSGGSAYDGLVALEAHEHGEVLLTRDQRAARTYRRLGVAFELLA